MNMTTNQLNIIQNPQILRNLQCSSVKERVYPKLVGIFMERELPLDYIMCFAINLFWGALLQSRPEEA